jgi:hypothetical protein
MKEKGGEGEGRGREKKQSKERKRTYKNSLSLREIVMGGEEEEEDYGARQEKKDGFDRCC